MGFQKAKPEQAALKMSMFGPPGSGKTLTALLIAEGLAKATGKRIAFVDTEHGTDFYAVAVAARRVHPAAFDFDALYSKSLTEVLSSVRGLNPSEYGIVVIDSITHLWEAAKNAYKGKINRNGQIPAHAWGPIKRPYKDLMHSLINGPMHVLILGRQGSEFAQDEDSGDMTPAGVKMKAEGETAYEPHICLRMEAMKILPGEKKAGGKYAEQVITAFAEKDRSGCLQGQLIQWPCFENIALPLLPLLGSVQAHVASDEDAAAQDADALAREVREKEAASRILRQKFEARLAAARDVRAVQEIGAEIALPENNKFVLLADKEALRAAYAQAKGRTEKAALTGNGRQPAAYVPGVDDPEADPDGVAEEAAMRSEATSRN